MKRPTAVILAVVVAGLIAAAAYTVGLRSHAPGDQPPGEVTAMSDTTPSAEGPASPIPAGATGMAALSDDQRAEVEGIIRNYLMANPEIVRDAINELQRRADEAAQVAQSKAIDDNAKLIFASANDGVLGNPKGDVTLVEFFDYNCAYCRRAQADMQKLIEKDPSLRVVLKEFPVLGDGSVQAAKVSVAVEMTAPDKYAAFHNALLAEPGQVDGERALAVAKEVGLDPDVLKAKLDDKAIQDRINVSYDLAGKLNLTGTPSYVTKKEVIVGAVGYDALKQKIDDARGCASC
jgi:protein-disulfide isomerase